MSTLALLTATPRNRCGVKWSSSASAASARHRSMLSSGDSALSACSRSSITGLCHSGMGEHVSAEVAHRGAGQALGVADHASECCRLREEVLGPRNVAGAAARFGQPEQQIAASAVVGGEQAKPRSNWAAASS